MTRLSGPNLPGKHQTTRQHRVENILDTLIRAYLTQDTAQQKNNKNSTQPSVFKTEKDCQASRILSIGRPARLAGETQ